MVRDPTDWLAALLDEQHETRFDLQLPFGFLWLETQPTKRGQALTLFQHPLLLWAAQVHAALQGNWSRSNAPTLILCQDTCAAQPIAIMSALLTYIPGITAPPEGCWILRLNPIYGSVRNALQRGIRGSGSQRDRSAKVVQPRSIPSSIVAVINPICALLGTLARTLCLHRCWSRDIVLFTFRPFPLMAWLGFLPRKWMN